MLSSVAIVGVVALLGVSVWRRSAARSSDSTTVASRAARTAEGVSVPGPGGHEAGSGTPGLTLRDVFLVAGGAAAVTLGALAVTAVLYDPGVGLPAKVTALLALLAGVTVLGSVVSGRLGVGRPRRVPTATHRRSLSAAFGEVAGRTFVDLRTAAATARRGWVDDATLAVLAAATAGADVGALESWAEGSGLADPAAVRERTAALSEAGLVAVDRGRVRLDASVADADAGRVVALAAEGVT